MTALNTSRLTFYVLLLSIAFTQVLAVSATPTTPGAFAVRADDDIDYSNSPDGL
ncbi:uncharacterized protein EDB91DRAFT_1243612 [Suillus paluster]|uniref:uncharacterized protein n=1 Tax=Suillus paluster TaxID=48578 RepID=UPI001B86F203|nr:uncharacterized protein EDB91DRAFT_1243612 [Suillus paluster]KAG1751341.1 hypothetical protein EDB91DRAFT_1243612 [Suillus paluster]